MTNNCITDFIKPVNTIKCKACKNCFIIFLALVSQFFDLLFDRSQVLDTVSGYAERLGISPSYLNKLVRTQTRHSAMDWVEISRVNWAKTLLKDSDMSVGEISIAIGVDDPSYFTRFFRKSTGMTPSEFRHEMERKAKLQ